MAKADPDYNPKTKQYSKAHNEAKYRKQREDAEKAASKGSKSGLQTAEKIYKKKYGNAKDIGTYNKKTSDLSEKYATATDAHSKARGEAKEVGSGIAQGMLDRYTMGAGSGALKGAIGGVKKLGNLAKWGRGAERTGQAAEKVAPKARTATQAAQKVADEKTGQAVVKKNSTSTPAATKPKDPSKGDTGNFVKKKGKMVETKSPTSTKSKVTVKKPETAPPSAPASGSGDKVAQYAKSKDPAIWDSMSKEEKASYKASRTTAPKTDTKAAPKADAAAPAKKKAGRPPKADPTTAPKYKDSAEEAYETGDMSKLKESDTDAYRSRYTTKDDKGRDVVKPKSAPSAAPASRPTAAPAVSDKNSSKSTGFVKNKIAAAKAAKAQAPADSAPASSAADDAKAKIKANIKAKSDAKSDSKDVVPSY